MFLLNVVTVQYIYVCTCKALWAAFGWILRYIRFIIIIIIIIIYKSDNSLILFFNFDVKGFHDQKKAYFKIMLCHKGPINIS